MTAAFVLGQDVDLRLEDLVGMDSAGLSQNLATLDLGTVNTTQQSADVIAQPQRSPETYGTSPGR